MPKVYYGTDELKTSWEEYYERCNAIQLDLSTFPNEPKPETMNKWRVESPKGFAFILHADVGVRQGFQQMAGTDEPDEVDLEAHFGAGWEKTMEQADHMAAKAILLRTPGALTPGTANRRLLERFAARFVDPTDLVVLWEPAGLWNIKQTREFAAQVGLTPTYDPFLAHREDLGFEHGDVGFTITERAAMRRQFDIFDFKQMLSWTRNYDRLFVMCRGRHKWAHIDKLSAAVKHANR